ncbi:MFS transporter [Streptomyces sp. NPDC005917]|uniref:MFS transporter n=1 Tax=unclassified Streptomyces TaxID=2593676 RepID=UPI0033DB9397
MIRRNTDPHRMYAVFRRIDGELPLSMPEHGEAVFSVEENDSGKRAALTSLFTGRWLWGTVLLWFVFMINLAEFYALQSWLPTIVTDLGHSMSVVVAATTLTTVGGIAAAFVTGPSMDRLGPYRTLGVLYLAGCVCVALTGTALHEPLWVPMTANFFAGCCVSGGRKSLIALAAVFYPGRCAPPASAGPWASAAWAASSDPSWWERRSPRTGHRAPCSTRCPCRCSPPAWRSCCWGCATAAR